MKKNVREIIRKVASVDKDAALYLCLLSKSEKVAIHWNNEAIELDDLFKWSLAEQFSSPWPSIYEKCYSQYEDEGIASLPPNIEKIVSAVRSIDVDAANRILRMHADYESGSLDSPLDSPLGWNPRASSIAGLFCWCAEDMGYCYWSDISTKIGEEL